MSGLAHHTGMLKYPTVFAIYPTPHPLNISTLTCRPRIMQRSRISRAPSLSRSLWHCRHPSRRVSAFRRQHQFRPKALHKLAWRILHPKSFGSNRLWWPWWKCWGAGLGWRRFKSSFSGHGWRSPRPNPDQDIWEEEDARLREKVDRMKREIDKDPYTALFGRRLEPFMDMDKHRSWSDFYRAFLGLGFGNSAGGDGNVKTADTTARVKTDGYRPAGEPAEEAAEEPKASQGADAPKSQDGPEPELEFDPVSGRMIPKARVVDVESLDASVKSDPGDTADEKNMGANADPGHVSGPLTQTSKEHQRKHRRRLRGKDKRKTLTDVTRGFPEAQNLQASDAVRDVHDRELDRQIAAEPSEHPSDMPPEQTISSVEVDKEQPAGSPALDVNETPEQTAGSVEADKEQPVDSPVPDMNETPKTSPFRMEQDPFSRRKLKSEDLWKQMEEDVESLTARDIRASYISRKPDPDHASQKQENPRASEDEFEAYVDPASKVDAHESREKHSDSSERPGESSSATTAEEDATVVEQAHEGNAEPAVNAEPALSPELDQAPVESTPPAMYRILAYDPSTLQVTAAEASSSHAADEALHPTEALSRLNNPAKFLPYFATMHNDGYEIASGGGDILVFKKVRPGGPVSAPSSYDTQYSPENMQSVEYSQAGNKTEQPPRTVRRHETVYTGGPPNWSPYPPPPQGQPVSGTGIPPPKSESTFRKVARRMLLAGGATAACCYAIGVVGEYFRTGGQDGQGTEGFTEFESERRRR